MIAENEKMAIPPKQPEVNYSALRDKVEQMLVEVTTRILTLKDNLRREYAGTDEAEAETRAYVEQLAQLRADREKLEKHLQVVEGAADIQLRRRISEIIQDINAMVAADKQRNPVSPGEIIEALGKSEKSE